jgi:hypothetical protein
MKIGILSHVIGAGEVGNLHRLTTDGARVGLAKKRRHRLRLSMVLLSLNDSFIINEIIKSASYEFVTCDLALQFSL